jgi:hypothetical protein
VARVASAPAISVLLPVYDAAATVEAALASVLAQTLADLEVIAIDDGSADASAAILERAAQRDPRVRVLRQPHTGLPGALAAGLAVARGELIARMDADDLARPERLARQARYLAAHPACVALGTGVVVVDPRGRAIKQPRIPVAHEDIDRQLLAGIGWAMIHPTVVMRRDAVRAIGGYRAEFARAQDIDLFLRLAERGRLANLAEPLVELRQRVADPRVVAAQMALKVRAIGDAYARRGAPPPPLAAIEPEVRLPDAAQHLAWAAFALRAGRVHQAAEHAADAARAAPHSLRGLASQGRALATAALADARRRRRWCTHAHTPPPLFITAANARFAPIARVQQRELARLGYATTVYDLGGLGAGVPLPVAHAGFHASGVYHVRDGRTSHALHKPDVIGHALAALEPERILVYLDADAICFAHIDEIFAQPFDVALADRDRWDLAHDDVSAAYVGQFNAGVLGFRNTPATARFVARWRELTAELGNDQRALNTLVNPSGRRITAGARVTAAGGAAVHVIAGDVYNNRERYTRLGIKIVHFKRERWRAWLAGDGPRRPPDTLRELAPLAARWYGQLAVDSARGRFYAAHARLGAWRRALLR